MNSAPTVVLGMPVYNRPDTLARALESLLSQTYRDFAVVIVDDAPASQYLGQQAECCHSSGGSSRNSGGA